MKLILLFVLFITKLSYQKSTINSDFYTAVVVEYTPKESAGADDPPLLRNGNFYSLYIEEARKKNADIIVFPEDGLTTWELPSRESMGSWSTLIPLNYMPCNQTEITVHDVLNAISCAAQQSKIYVVINIAEKVPCNIEKCPKDKVLYFNSQVVFDRNGQIISKYRKTHLFSEPQFNVTPEPEIVTFETDFGVTFGTFICFDILFKEPGLTLTRKLNITDIVYSSAWFSQVPFLTSLQTQYGWSYAEDVNFLASGYNRVASGNAGSGIYLGRKGICEARELKEGSELITCQVPKKDRNVNRAAINTARSKLLDNRKNYAGLHIHDELRKRDATDLKLFYEDMAAYKSINLNSTSLKQSLCDGDFCCHFNIEITETDPNSIYKLVILNGVTTYFNQPPVTVGVQSCGVVQCANETLTSCGVRLKSQTTFSSIKINATFDNYDDIVILPSSIDVNLLPIPDWTYKQHFGGNKVLIEASLGSKPVKDLLTCGLYARLFDRDALDNTRIVSVLQIATIIALVAITIFFIFLYRKGWKIPIRRTSQGDTEPYHSLQNPSK